MKCVIKHQLLPSPRVQPLDVRKDGCCMGPQAKGLRGRQWRFFRVAVILRLHIVPLKDTASTPSTDTDNTADTDNPPSRNGSSLILKWPGDHFSFPKKRKWVPASEGSHFEKQVAIQIPEGLIPIQKVGPKGLIPSFGGAPKGSELATLYSTRRRVAGQERLAQEWCGSADTCPLGPS